MNSNKKKVLFFLQSGVGGAERMTIFIANCLNENEYDVIFYVIGKDFGLITKFLPQNRKHHLIKVDSYRDFLTFKMIGVLSKEKPQIVFSSVFPFNYRLCIASTLFPKIHVIIRSDSYLFTQSPIQRFRLFIGYRFLNYLIVQTDEMKIEHIRQMCLSSNKIGTYSNPVDTKTIERKIINCTSPLSDSLKNYVYVGRLAEVKGVDILLYAFSQLVKKEPDSRLYIVGDTSGIFIDYYKMLLNIIETTNLSNNVVFVGFNDNPYVYMKFADCFVLPSRVEGLPNVVIESLYLGTPVAVTNSVPVVKRIVQEGINGYIAEVDNVESLRDAMLEASKLGRIVSAYNSATEEDFEKLFR